MNVQTGLAGRGKLPSVDELLERARQLRPLLQDRATETEEDGRVSADVISRLKRAQLIRLGQPASFGGGAYPPSAMFRLAFELARGCGSTAWCAIVANQASALAASWSHEAQHDIWGADPENLVCGVVMPSDKCAVAPGGFEIAGRWPYASNCDNSDWIFVAARFPAIEGVPPDMGFFMVPRSEFRIDHESWRAAGMQGTGSKTVIMDAPVFVPQHRVLRFSDVVRGTAPGRQLPDNILTRFSFATFSAAGFAGCMLGMAQGALEYFETAMTAKVKMSLGPGVPVTVGQTSQAQITVGEASAAIDSSAALLLADLHGAEAKILAGSDVTAAERIRIRRDTGFAAAQAILAVNTLFEAAGAGSTALSNPIQRYWRNINVAGRHTHLDPQATYALFGQERFGLKPQTGF